MTTRRFALNKTELTRLSREEKTYQQFLPVLQLKQEQLQTEQLKLKRQLTACERETARLRAEVERYAPLLAEPLLVPLTDLARVEHISLGEKSVAGVRVPTLERVVFTERQYSRFGTGVWVSSVLPDLRLLVKQSAELSILRHQAKLVTRELRKATQKVNLFEKVLVPETRAGIKRIKIALGDQQVAAVGRGKIAKAKHQPEPHHNSVSPAGTQRGHS